MSKAAGLPVASPSCRLLQGASDAFVTPSASDAGKRKRTDAAAAPAPRDAAPDPIELCCDEARWQDRQRLSSAAAPVPASIACRPQQGHTRAAHSGAPVHVQRHGSVAGVLAAASLQPDCADALCAADGTAQLDTITEVTDEVFDTPMLAGTQLGTPAALAFTPASILSTAPPQAAVASVCTQQAELSKGSGAGAAVTRVQPQGMSDSSGILRSAHELARSGHLCAPTAGPAGAGLDQLAQAEITPPVAASASRQPSSPLAPSAAPACAVAEGQDVTLCTAAAFAELNDMFSSVLQHAKLTSPAGRATTSLPPAGAALEATACADMSAPGNEENACPGGGRPAGRARLAPRSSPPRRLHSTRSAPVASQRVLAGRKPVASTGASAEVRDMAPAVVNPACCLAVQEAGPVAVTHGPWASKPATDVGVVSASQRSCSPQHVVLGGGNGGGDYREPTVTLATREAFAALNGMFAAQLPHERAAGAVAPRPAVPLGPPRQSTRRSLVGGAAPGSPRGRGMLCAAAGAVAAAREDTRTLPIYEDTQFLRAPATSPADGPAASGLRPVEDTQPLFLDAAPALDRTATLAIYEDTQLLAQGPLPSARRGAGAPAMRTAPLSSVAGPGDATAPLRLYEDTQFLTRALPQRFDDHVATPFAAVPAPLGTPATEVQQVRCRIVVPLSHLRSHAFHAV